MNERVKKGIISYAVVFAILVLSHFIVKKWGWNLTESFITETIAAIVALIIYYLSQRNYEKEKVFMQIDDELKDRVSYKVYNPKMEEIDLRFKTKAEQADVDGLKMVLNSVDKNVTKLLEIHLKKGK
jgi:hypothetical protein